LREIAILKACKHPNIVNLINIIFNDTKLSLIFEFCDYDLKKYMQKYTKLNPKEIKVF